MDYEKIIHAFVDGFVEHKDAIMIRELPSDSDKDIVLLIVAENEDTARLIGRKGIIADALREV
ncbi:MAG: KH domain-containing protein, partial [Firmicutes bacterium]|nr:KH domain-containing protein [Bacillota bacterium]